MAIGRTIGIVAVSCIALTSAADSARRPEAAAMKIPDSAMEPVAWSDLDGWAADDHAAAYAAFLTSCKAILARTPSIRKARPVFEALRAVCRRAPQRPLGAAEARAFFEANFRPVRITRLGEEAGFLTGYYEPIVAGSRFPSPEYAIPMFRRPADLVVIKQKRKGESSSKVVRRFGRKSVPYYDRAQIEDGALDGRHLEICWLKDPIEAFFIHIQGSARIRLEDGAMLRINYDAQNGHPYMPVGRILIERGIVPKEEMSLDRIRQWMLANPEEGRALRRMNKSFVFFRITNLSDNEEANGAQGVSLAPGRSIAVDRALHVYGMPFWIEAELPIDSEAPTTRFRRLMLAQDTGGAIVGPARADIYFGAGDAAGRIAGRIRHPGRFVMLVPRALDPVVAGKRMPMPRPQPSAKMPPGASATAPALPPKAKSDAASKSTKGKTVARPAKTHTKRKPGRKT